MTTVYKDYYEAYDRGIMNLNNISFLVMLLDETYIPSNDHKLDDLIGLILTVPYVIVNDDIITLTMGEIIQKSIENIMDYARTYPNEITEGFENLFEERSSNVEIEDYHKNFYLVFYNPSLNILCFSEQITKNDLIYG